MSSTIAPSSRFAVTSWKSASARRAGRRRGQLGCRMWSFDASHDRISICVICVIRLASGSSGVRQPRPGTSSRRLCAPVIVSIVSTRLLTPANRSSPRPLASGGEVHQAADRRRVDVGDLRAGRCPHLLVAAGQRRHHRAGEIGEQRVHQSRLANAAVATPCARSVVTIRRSVPRLPLECVAPGAQDSVRPRG